MGAIDHQLICQIFVNYKFFYQKEENAWGGVLMLLKNSLSVTIVKCDIPNVCVVNVKVERNIRLIRMYAPRSKSSDWNVLSQFITDGCCLAGDFNVDIHSAADEAMAENLMTRSDSLLLTTNVC